MVIGEREVGIDLPEDCGFVQEFVSIAPTGDGDFEDIRYGYCQLGECPLVYGESITGIGATQEGAADDAGAESLKLLGKYCKATEKLHEADSE